MGTTTSDYLDRTLALGYVKSSIMLFCMVLAVLVAWHFSTGKIQFDRITTRVYYAKHPEAGGDYSMDHSSVIYVMDPEGRFTASFTHESTPEQISERLKKLLG